MEGLKPFFESSDTGSKVYMLEGSPTYLDFQVNGQSHKVSLPVMLEMYKLFNGIWYSGLWKMLGICCSGFCGLPPGHIRTEKCPVMTEYEKKVYDDYLRQMRGLHMAENRPPIANSTTSDNSQH
jgi:hypothetical protein